MARNVTAHKRRGPALGFAAGLLALLIVGAATAEPRHGISAFGDLKYPADFTNFDYVNVDAPKGGTLRLRGTLSFDTVNPFTLKGIRFRGRNASAMGLPYDSLMTGTSDEPDSMYGLVAETADLADDRTSIVFKLRPEARFHDGSPMTVDDIVFSFTTLKERGSPGFRIIYKSILGVEAIGEDQVKFTFDPEAELRDLPRIAAGMPILSKTYYSEVDFEKTTLVPPLGSGPYRITKVDPGRTITLERVEDYWAKDLPVNVGRYNFGKIKIEFFKDRDVAHEGFKSGVFDFQEEFTSRIWATGYDFPAVRDGRVVKEAVPIGGPASRQYFALNMRRDKFKDRRVRQAINLAFDFEWTNENLFYSVYRRTGSIFENTNMAARELPTDAELELLNPFRDQLPPEVFTQVYEQPKTDGSGSARANLRKARQLLADAGWTIQGGRLRDEAGKVFEVEFLLRSPSFERIIAPIIKNLDRLGIDAKMRTVDAAQYGMRVREERDFDITTAAFGVSATPGVGEKNFWGSEAADLRGANNFSGIKDPVVDALLVRLAEAQDRESLTLAARALDRVLLWNQYIILQWFRANYTIAYWDIFGRPETRPTYSLGFLDTWWIDPGKTAGLKGDRDNL
ncbi:MAG: ABC transporter substrate-binding protein [Proteobacteria bacterium]|nr:ABC transporter substrate-binding protein [Pseudomonadota bacterium]